MDVKIGSCERELRLVDDAERLLHFLARSK